jgi:NAD(P)-dependent dehydrogenase (short-subunit alcohol dehydrogenase family)
LQTRHPHQLHLTRFNQQTGAAQSWPDGVNRWLKAAPLQRLGEPEDVADACLFFASPSSRWITGAELVVDGGILSCQVYKSN